MKYNFLVNANCKNVDKTVKKLSEYLDSLSIAYSFDYSQYHGHLGELAKKLEIQCVSNIVVMGGDGSINEVLNGLLDPSSIPIGIIPIGTGNDFAKSVKISKDPIVAMRGILNGNIQSVDYFTSLDRRAINTVSIGIDIQVLTRYNKKKRKNKLSYYNALLKSLISYRCKKMQFVVDGFILSPDRYFVAVAANGKYFGGNMKISPNSSLHDGKIHFVAIKKLPFYKIPLALIGMIRGKHIRKKYTQEIPCNTVQCNIEDNSNSFQTVNYDGELLDNSLFDIRVVQGGVRIYLPVV
ncbi:MAG: YegS/Rv2252/BmrU family lipid kinase [Firmicutes bacterium]|nr:YegS/Rv2252/BmrU family lipid kinase [Bacillota bacterium]MCL1953666.1 YegS/Rv2252/BmrU family lipid kinase [Bacillota bacterium]